MASAELRFSDSVERCFRSSAAAYERGFFKDLVVPFRGLERDGILRPDTSLEKLASLKPAFDASLRRIRSH